MDLIITTHAFLELPLAFPILGVLVLVIVYWTLINTYTVLGAPYHNCSIKGINKNWRGCRENAVLTRTKGAPKNPRNPKP